MRNKFRGYIKKEGNLYMGFCVDLTLAVQGESYDEAVNKLNAVIADYINEALTVDSKYKEQLLNRKAGLAEYIKYYYIAFLSRFKKEPLHCNLI
ncbi:MAG: hypothetical protein M0Z72_01380 [Deltaproteobacteria bacterium]|nr:hypothetical protein [Deltaproteobacteria bacterium]